jgi:hypothetical protein
MTQIRGKQIANNSLMLNKLSNGVKFLPVDSKIGSEKSVSQITDSHEFTTKEYVDSSIDAASTGLTTVELEETGGYTSGNGIVSYSKDFDFGTSKTTRGDVRLFINSIRISTPDVAFFSDSSTGIRRETPMVGDKLYFDVDILGYHVEYDDLVQISYLESSALQASQQLSSIDLMTDSMSEGGTSYIRVGSKGFREVPFSGKIVSYTIVTNEVGSIKYTIKRSRIETMESSTSILQASLTNQKVNKVAGLNIEVSEGDLLEFIVDEATISKSQIFMLILRN